MELWTDVMEVAVLQHFHCGTLAALALPNVRPVATRPCFNCFKELTHERLIKAYPFQVLPVCQLCHLGYDDSGQYPMQTLQ